jgi:predicted lipid-binding transport protein (Tim44 family)
MKRPAAAVASSSPWPEFLRRRGRALRTLAWSLLPAALGLLWVVPAFARPGGGHGYSGGSNGSSGHGGDGDGGGDLGPLLAYLVELTWRHPKVMLPLWGLAGLGYWIRSRGSGGDWTAGGLGSAGESETPAERPPLPRQQLEALRQADPQFSLVVFEDFLQALYARVQEARGAHALETVGPYLAPELRERLERESATLAGVEAVVVGAMSYRSVRLDAPGGRVQVQLEFEANYTEVDANGGRQGYYVAEVWTLSRARRARSRPPEQVRSFGCPACGAPLTGLRDDTCAHCGNRVTSGELDWRVEAVGVERRDHRGPQLAGHAPELGTLTPTIVDPLAQTRRDELAARDPAFAWEAFLARVRLVFAEAQVAWSSQELVKARPYLSDNLFQTWVYWIEAYRAAGLRNVTEGSRVLGVRLARVTSDAYYDAITVRLRAIGLDYTLDASGAVVSGSRSDPREYSEYWTLVRGAAVRGAPRVDRSCPRCGAPLQVTMAGACEYCSAHVVSGEFDWVLSRIEQDESYQG